MGFLDKLTGGRQLPDYASLLTEKLGEGDIVRAAAQAIPSAYKRSGGAGPAGPNRLLSKGLDMVQNKVSCDRHVGGEENQIARTLPREGELSVLAISDEALTIWDFGMFGNDPDPDLLASVPRADVTSLVDTGTKAQGGVPVARVTFSDGSFFDYRLTSKPGPDFWAVASAL